MANQRTRVTEQDRSTRANTTWRSWWSAPGWSDLQQLIARA